jgi:hypothetical protein
MTEDQFTAQAILTFSSIEYCGCLFDELYIREG